MPFNFSSPEYLSHHRTRKNRVSPVSRASPAHMNNPYEITGNSFENIPTNHNSVLLGNYLHINYIQILGGFDQI